MDAPLQNRFSKPQPRPIFTAEADIVGFLIAALWLGFAGMLLRGVAQHYELWRHAGRACYDASAAIVTVVGAYRLLLARRDQTMWSTYFHCYLMLGAALLAGVVGFLYHNSLVLWVLNGFFPFMSAVGIVMGRDEKLFERILRAVMYQTYLATLFALYVLVFARPSDRTEWSGEIFEGPARMASRSLYAVPFLAAYLGRLRRRHAYVVALAYIECAALHVLGANRGPTLIYFVLLPTLLSGLSLWRDRSPRVWLRSIGPLLVLIAILAAVGNVYLINDDELMAYADDRLGETVARLSHGESGDLQELSQGTIEVSQDEFFGDSSRGGEIRDFLSQMEPLDWVCGRGFGGTWLSSFWGSRSGMVHIGFGHLLLVGGMPLLLGFVLLVVQAFLKAARAVRTSEAAPGVICYMAAFTVNFTQHGALSDDPELMLFWLAVGMALGMAAPARASKTARFARFLTRPLAPVGLRLARRRGAA